MKFLFALLLMLGTTAANAAYEQTPFAISKGGTGLASVPAAGQMLLGNAGGTAYALALMSGDATMASTGVMTIASGAITNAKIAAATIDLAAKVAGVLPVANGGTGLATVPAGDILVWNGTSAPNPLAGGTTGNIVTWNGTAWVSQAPASGGANTALSNLASTAVNVDIIPGAADSASLGSSTFNFVNGFFAKSLQSAYTLGFTGDTTSGSATINVTNTAGLEVGMMVQGSGIPNGGVTIGSIITNTSITLAPSPGNTVANATATASAVSLSAISSMLAKSADQTGSVFSGLAQLFSGSTVNGNSGVAVVASGSVSGTGASGVAKLLSGNTASGNTGAVTVSSGIPGGAGNSGGLTLTSAQIGVGGTGTTGSWLAGSGQSLGANTGNVNLSSGLVPGGAGNSGNLTLKSGAIISSGSGASGTWTAGSGASLAGASGAVTLASGDSTSGNSGAVLVKSGTAGGTRGSVTVNGLGISLVGGGGNVNLNSTEKLINVVDPTSAQDAATKNYVDTSLAAKQNAKMAVVDGGNAPYTILATDDHVRDTTTLTADRAYTLPACTAGNIGERHEVKNLPAQTHNITLTAAGSDNVDGNATVTILPGDSIPVVCAAFSSSGTWDIQ